MRIRGWLKALSGRLRQARRRRQDARVRRALAKGKVPKGEKIIDIS